MQNDITEAIQLPGRPRPAYTKGTRLDVHQVDTTYLVAQMLGVPIPNTQPSMTLPWVGIGYVDLCAATGLLHGHYTQ